MRRHNSGGMGIMNTLFTVLILLSKFGGQMDGVVPKYSSQSIYECANDWVSQGNMHCAGIVQYYKAYYAKGN